MKGRTMHHFTVACTMAIVALLWSPTTSLTGEKALDTATIERLTGVKGELSEKEGGFKVSVPRSDLDTTVAGVKLTRTHDFGPGKSSVPPLDREEKSRPCVSAEEHSEECDASHSCSRSSGAGTLAAQPVAADGRRRCHGASPACPIILTALVAKGFPGAPAQFFAPEQHEPHQEP